MSGFAERVAKLSPEKRALLAQLVSAKGQPQEAPPILAQPRGDDGVFPVSSTQERFWFIYQLDPTSPAYNVPLLVRLVKELDIEALERSLNEIVRRHEILRTVFQIVDGQPVQLVLREQPIPVVVIDLRPLADNEARGRKVERLTHQEARKPFDLSQGPLLRATLLQLPEENALILTLHHILVDQRSIGMLGIELEHLYGAYTNGRAPSLPPLPVQYADYTIWHRGQKWEKELAYWTEHLRSPRAKLNLPTDYPRPAIQQTAHGACYRKPLPAALTEQVKAFSRQEGATLFMTLLAVFDVLLHRYTNQTDIMVGSLIANRTRPELQGLIGCFINTLVFRCKLEGNPTFRNFLRQVKQVALDAYRYSELPFEVLVNALQPERNLSQTPLFQVLFEVLSDPLELQGEGQRIVLDMREIETGTARFDLRLELIPEGDTFVQSLTYNTDLFEAGTIERLADHYETLLQAIVANPEQRISAFKLLTDVEKEQLLVEWNRTEADYPQDSTMVQLLEGQARRTPEKAAVSYGTEHLTYEQLNRQANQLAHHLRSLGVGPDVLVGICLERSLEMMVAMLGVLKAGGAYVPLDPAYPQERLAYMLQDARVPVLLTRQRILTYLPGYQGQVVCLDADWEVIAQENEENPVTNLAAGHLAYVLYTSGSTGKPKGVMVNHRNLVHSTMARLHAYDDPVTGFLLLSPFAFDSSVAGIYWTLCQGGTLVLPWEDPQSDLPGLIKLIARRRISHLLCVPPLYRLLLEQGEPERLASLRVVIVAGEACPKALIEQHYATLPYTTLFNEYGPTEATVWCSVYHCQAAEERDVVPIGRPISNSQLYLLDPYLQPVPIGIPGELYVGGEGLARGYWQRPALTAGRFVPHPFSGKPGACLYRTGDLARFRPDGNVEFLGRVDYQVKIRGFRIELGEIETALNEHPAVRESALVVREEEADNRQLIAYVVSNRQESDAKEQITDAEHVSHWQMVYDDIHAQLPTYQDPTFNVTGWNSSYTGLPIPDEEMREWVGHTVGRILAWRPRRVLEIGCGTGLLLFRIAPHCERYWGTDFARGALDHVQEHLPEAGEIKAEVKLFHTQADDFIGIAAERFDTVILNSVVQYFPGIEYLKRVLENAVAAVEPGGKVFIGDVRSLPLLEAFHTSVQLHRAPPSLSGNALAEQVRRALERDKELVIDPAFFRALAAVLPQISHVEIRLKRGRHENEMTKFRYDVVLHVGELPYPAVKPGWLEWSEASLSLPAIRQRLVEDAPAALGIRGVPNARLMAEVKAVEWLSNGQGPEKLEALWEAMKELPATGVDPEAFWAMSGEFPYDVSIRWSEAGTAGCFDVIFRRRVAEDGRAGEMVFIEPEEAVQPRPWPEYANNPLRGQALSTADLRYYLQERLPSHMIPSTFILLETLPRNPNGKVDRPALPAPTQEQVSEQKGYVPPRTPTEKVLAEIWGRVLGRERIGVHDNFFELGGDSILSIRILARANQAGLKFTSMDLFKYQTIAELATAAQHMGDVQAEQGLVSGSVPLTAIQQWFFEQEFTEPHYWNQAVLLEAPRPLQPEALGKAIGQLLVQHDALRLRFVRSVVGWQQFYADPSAETPFSVVDLSAVAGQELEAAFEREMTQTQASLDLADGPLLRAVLFDLGAGRPSQLLLIIHHLVVDFVSLQILLADLQTAYQQLVGGELVALPPKTTSFKYWAGRITAYGQSNALAEQVGYWLAASRNQVAPLPRDFPEGVQANTQASARTVETWLGLEETRALLQEVPQTYHTQMNDVLLAALIQAFARWTGVPRLWFDLEGHGREELFDDVNLSRTVGWFTTMFPVLLELRPAAPPGQTLKSVKEQLRGIPRRGLGYGLLRYFGGSPDPAEAASIQQKLRAQAQAEVSFNYLGQFNETAVSEGLFHLSKRSSGLWYSPQGRRPHLIDVHGIVVNDQLRLQWIYSANVHGRQTIECLAEDYMEGLRSLIEHCLSPEAGGFTPSDFPLAGLSQQQLDRILEKRRGQ
ncbi:MAG: amino acid adenylation domain-containing protein [Chloroflexi bacterium]|nr:amino acid adenylation domain-containing protein [Chloroflexota bacterium]MCI0648023.1 amino acid adenylation domain-containing protein [Chloroflexota bacterium]